VSITKGFAILWGTTSFLQDEKETLGSSLMGRERGKKKKGTGEPEKILREGTLGRMPVGEKRKKGSS